MTTIAQWFSGARPRTLPAAVVPVAIGAAVSNREQFDTETLILHGALSLVVSLALQVAVNYANDYSDGVRGTDNARSGPLRLVGSGAATPSAVRRAAFVSFVVAAIAGVILAAMTTWWLIAVGLLCIIAAWTYTGGPKPYGYAGLGELFVFIFFGLVATVGTSFAIANEITVISLLAGCVAGFLAVALLVVNNLRDLQSDAASGKMTLAVRLGARATRVVYVCCYVGAALGILLSALMQPGALLGLVGLLAVLPAVSTVLQVREPASLIPALAMTARAQLVVGVLYALGFVIQS